MQNLNLNSGVVEPNFENPIFSCLKAQILQKLVISCVINVLEMIFDDISNFGNFLEALVFP